MDSLDFRLERDCSESQSIRAALFPRRQGMWLQLLSFNLMLTGDCIVTISFLQKSGWSGHAEERIRRNEGKSRVSIGLGIFASVVLILVVYHKGFRKMATSVVARMWSKRQARPESALFAASS